MFDDAMSRRITKWPLGQLHFRYLMLKNKSYKNIMNTLESDIYWYEIWQQIADIMLFSAVDIDDGIKSIKKLIVFEF